MVDFEIIKAQQAFERRSRAAGFTSTVSLLEHVCFHSRVAQELRPGNDGGLGRLRSFWNGEAFALQQSRNPLIQYLGVRRGSKFGLFGSQSLARKLNKICLKTIWKLKNYGLIAVFRGPLIETAGKISDPALDYLDCSELSYVPRFISNTAIHAPRGSNALIDSQNTCKLALQRIVATSECF